MSQCARAVPGDHLAHLRFVAVKFRRKSQDPFHRDCVGPSHGSSVPGKIPHELRLSSQVLALQIPREREKLIGVSAAKQ
jgi:hypothetical protein